MAHDDQHQHGWGRLCHRTGCNREAVASLTFRYETRQVWVTALAPDSSGNRYDLCVHHADALTVPKGWHRVEERGGQRRTPRHHNRANRTAARSRAAIPEPAAPRRSSARPQPQPAAVRQPAPAPVPAPAAEAAPAPDVTSPPADRYARLLSDLPRLAAEMAPAAAETATMPTEVLGQLSIDVGDTAATDAVVVSLEELVGARRRAGRDSLRT